MTQDEIIEITRQAGGFDATPKFLEAVAKLVVQRTWVGLTDEEIAQMGLNNYRQVVRETEAALKAKNIEGIESNPCQKKRPDSA